MSSRSEAESRCQRDLFFIAFFPLREVDGASYRPSGAIHARGFDRRGLGGHSELPKILTANPNLDPTLLRLAWLPTGNVTFVTDFCEKLK
jgi:hypothetical protein